jgi:hypothetical protein
VGNVIHQLNSVKSPGKKHHVLSEWTYTAGSASGQ